MQNCQNMNNNLNNTIKPTPPQTPLEKAKLGKCRINAPYPCLGTLKPNEHQAKMLQTDYAGKVSELTGILQYINHSMVLKEVDPVASDVLSCIAHVEMKHFRLIGDAIFKLGCKPVYCYTCNKQYMPWNPDFVYFGKCREDMLKSDILTEQEAIKQYRQTIGLVCNDVLEDLIERIILDEEYHIQILTELLETK